MPQPLLCFQDRRGEEQEDLEGLERSVPTAKTAPATDSTDRGPVRSDTSTADLEDFIDSVLLQCAEVRLFFQRSAN